MKLEKVISIFLHPVFMPVIIFHMLLVCVPEFKLILSPNIKIIYMVLISSSIIMPLISILIYNKTSNHRTIEMVNKEERVIPLLYSSFCILLGIIFTKNLLSPTPILLALFAGSFITTLLSSIICVFWKISLHMLGLGGALGSFIALEMMYSRFSELIIIFVLLAGITGFARLRLKAHNEKQI